jgi:hypothetical protein
MTEITYSPAEVCAALGLKREVLHGWGARRLLDFAGPTHPGVARQFRLLDVIKIAAMVNMTTLGMGIGQAASLAKAINRIPAMGEYLIATCDPPSHTVLVSQTSGAVISTVSDIKAFTDRIRSTDREGKMIGKPGVYLLDLFELTEQVRRGLSDNTWRDGLSTAESTPDLTIVVNLGTNKDDSENVSASPAPRRGRRNKRI